MNIKYFVRTTNDRVLDESFNRELGNDYTLLVDSEYKPVKSLIRWLNLMNEYDAILLEDDIILCKDFKNRIEEAINKYKDKIVNFFGEPRAYFQTKEESNFHFLQCRYYPQGISSTIAKELEPYVDEPKVAPSMCRVAIKLNLKLVQYRPCLVQHIDNNSLVGNRAFGWRRTPYFIDYLDELGITYEEASIKENQLKLETLLKEKFKK